MQINQFHLVFKCIHQFYVHDVVVNERLIIFGVPITKSFVGILVFLFTKFDKTDVIQSVTLLCRVRILLIQFKIIKLTYANDIKCSMVSAHLVDVIIEYSFPRRESFDLILTKTDLDTIDQIRQVKETCVPSCEYIRHIGFPERQKSPEKIILIITFDVGHIFTICLVGM